MDLQDSNKLTSQINTNTTYMGEILAEMDLKPVHIGIFISAGFILTVIMYTIAKYKSSVRNSIIELLWKRMEFVR